YPSKNVDHPFRKSAPQAQIDASFLRRLLKQAAEKESREMLGLMPPQASPQPQGPYLGYQRLKMAPNSRRASSRASAAANAHWVAVSLQRAAKYKRPAWRLS